MGYLFIFGTIFFTIYGQLVLKWRINMMSGLPENGNFKEIAYFFIEALIDPYIISGFVAAFVASLFWMAAMTKFELSFAYPFMSLAPVLILLLGVWFFDEAFTIGKILGLVFIVIGLLITVKF